MLHFPFQHELLTNEADSIILAQRLATNLEASDIILFTGELGCGKTFLCREIIKHFCGSDTTVTSPTFNLLQTYAAPQFTIYHFDLYRLKSSHEVYELGLEDALNGNLCLIEWPEIIENLLPKPVIKVHLQMITNSKRVCDIMCVKS